VPELPEVETTVRELKKAQPLILGAGFIDVWTDFEKMIKKPKNLEELKKEIKGKKIENIWRRGKNILFDLSGGKILLIHQKLTGHLLLGKWERKNDQWQAKIPGPLAEDPMNRFLHLMFRLDNGQMLALSDLRKFAKAEFGKREEILKELEDLGPEPLEKSFTFEKFKARLKGKKGKIKQVLMDQNVIAGIGNIYSDEILWEARISPFKEIKRLSDEELEKIYKAMRKILKRAIEFKGESISDFRRISGERGFYDKERKVYRREEEKCSRCSSLIQRKKIAGRSAHFCSVCQK